MGCETFRTIFQFFKFVFLIQKGIGRYKNFGSFFRVAAGFEVEHNLLDRVLSFRTGDFPDFGFPVLVLRPVGGSELLLDAVPARFRCIGGLKNIGSVYLRRW